MSSYYFESRAGRGHLLLGGVSQHRSSRWGSAEEAASALEQHLEVNRGAGRPCDGEVRRSHLPPEIFAHCPGGLPQAIGGKCFECGVTLTQRLAREHGERESKHAREAELRRHREEEYNRDLALRMRDGLVGRGRQ